MNVSLNPCYNYNKVSFSSLSEYEKHEQEYRNKEIKKAKTKKAVSECATVAIGLSILYFAMKRKFKYDKIKQQEDKIKKLANQKSPSIKLTLENLDEVILA